MPRQGSRAQHGHAALALYVAHGNLQRLLRRLFDIAQEIVEPVQPDDEIDAGNCCDLSGIYLRVTARYQHLRPRIQTPGPAYELARFPVGAVGHRAGVDDVAIGFVLERNKRMPLFQAALNHRRIVLVDLAPECSDGDPHVFASLRISNCRSHIS